MQHNSYPTIAETSTATIAAFNVATGAAISIKISDEIPGNRGYSHVRDVGDIQSATELRSWLHLSDVGAQY